MHVLNWVHPCRALNNALSLLPLAHVTGSALHKAPVKIGYCSPRAAAGQLCRPALGRDAETPGFQLEHYDDFSLLLLLQEFWFHLPLTAWQLRSCSQKSVWPGKQTIWLCSEPVLFALAEQGALRAVGSFVLISWAWDWHLATSASTCKYKQTVELYFASCIAG